MKLNLALLLSGLVTSTLYASDMAQDSEEEAQPELRIVFDDGESFDGASDDVSDDVSDEERLELALQRSLETAAAAESFRKKQAEYANAERTPMGNVMFEALKRDAGNTAGNSADVNELQLMINRVRDALRSANLTDVQQDEAEGLLISLATQMSKLSSAERLGAPKDDVLR